MSFEYEKTMTGADISSKLLCSVRDRGLYAYYSYNSITCEHVVAIKRQLSDYNSMDIIIEHYRRYSMDDFKLYENKIIDFFGLKSASSRPSKDEYYLGIAQAVAKRSTCIRRQYGAVIVKDDRIISTGYNGSARGEDNCCDKGVCWREENHIPHGEQYEKCQAVHAEANAIINGNPSDMIGATLYLAGYENGELIEEPEPCMMCRRLITNARIEKVINKF